MCFAANRIIIDDCPRDRKAALLIGDLFPVFRNRRIRNDLCAVLRKVNDTQRLVIPYFHSILICYFYLNRSLRLNFITVLINDGDIKETCK